MKARIKPPLTISVVTAVYNRAKTIRQALASVRAQTGVEVEHIVIDGGSTDGTLQILEAQRAQLAVLVSEPDRGIYDALNKGFARATGDVVGLLHSDDVLAGPPALRHVADAFADPRVEAVYGDLDYMTPDGRSVLRRWRPGRFTRRKLAWGWMPPHPTFYARRSLYRRLGLFDTSYRIAADYDLMLRFLTKGGVEPVYIPETLVKMRWGGESNRSLSHIVRKSGEDLRALRGNKVGGLGALCWKNLSKLDQFL